MYTKLKLFVFLSIVLMACSEETEELTITTAVDQENMEEIAIEIPDWTEETHAKDTELDYATVFPQNEVLRVDITIDATDWQSMQDDLARNLNTSGPANVDFTPVWMPCSFKFNDKEWYKVGIRYKGNSTLTNAARSNTDKYPFKLDFDEFEETYPAIKNQRFYGFKQLNLGTNLFDDSFIRERVATDAFRNFGVPAARTAFCEVYLDRGNGPNYVGLYTLVEEVDDTMIESQFDDGDGNLYKPDGDAAAFSSGSYEEEELGKKNNEDEADFSDVKQLYDVINSATRTSDLATWKANLESILDMNQYLKYLAANTIIQNWDTYGFMTHNYFLYNRDGKLVWIPSDHNEALNAKGKMGGPISLSLSEVGNNWPLIRYIADIDEYKLKYEGYLDQFKNEVFNTSNMLAEIEAYRSLLQPYAAKETNGFNAATDEIIDHIENRESAVEDDLN